MAANHTAAAATPTMHAPSEPVKVEATIESVVDASASAKLLRMRVTDSRFVFAAGQWVDFFAPGVDQIGGYSIASPPSLLQSSGLLQLVVKRSTYRSSFQRALRRPHPTLTLLSGGVTSQRRR